KKEGRIMGHKRSLLLALFIGFALLLGTSSLQGQAKKRILEVAILDFNNQSKYGGKMVGRRAADAVALSLTSVAGDYYTVLSRADLEKEMEAEGLSYPLDKVDMVRLGRTLGLDGIITGTVLQVEISRSNGATQAGVMVACQMLDISTEEPITGAVATGKSSPKYDYSGDIDILVDEALNKAAYQIAQQFISFAVRGVPEFTILTTMGDEVLLNAGSRQGIKVGMEMVVLRRGEKVGRIRVKEVTLTDATATIVEAPRGIQGGDKARIVYELPPLGKAPLEQEIKSKAKTSLQKTLPALLLAFGIYQLMQKSSSATSGPRPSTCYACEVGGQPAVYLSWDYRKIPNPTNIAAVMVYRSPTPTMPSAPSAIPSDSDIYLIWSWRVSPGSTPPNSCFDSTSLPATITRYTPSDDGTSLDTNDITTVPLTPGRQYYYFVIGVITYTPLVPPSTTGGRQAANQQGVQYIWSDPIPLGGYTPIIPPTPLSPANNSEFLPDDLKKMTFQWQAVDGANEYVVELSTDPSFPRDKTWRSNPLFATAKAGDILMLDSPDLSVRFGNASVLYWRVGAINNNDSQRPPQGYVFYPGFFRITKTMPPGPP
ncbi:MAG: hypothetical protein ACP5KZ_02485, partial [bacterium]